MTEQENDEVLASLIGKYMPDIIALRDRLEELNVLARSLAKFAGKVTAGEVTDTNVIQEVLKTIIFTAYVMGKGDGLARRKVELHDGRQN